MAGGNVLGFPYNSSQSLIGWSLESWHSFEGWATSQGIKLLETSCRSYLNLIFYFLTKDMDEEGVESFELRLEQIESEAEIMRQRTKDRAAAKAVKKTEVPAAPTSGGKKTWNGWVKPEGWTPPGWNEQKSMQAAMGFMKFRSNPK